MCILKNCIYWIFVCLFTAYTLRFISSRRFNNFCRRFILLNKLFYLRFAVILYFTFFNFKFLSSIRCKLHFFCKLIWLIARGSAWSSTNNIRRSSLNGSFISFTTCSIVLILVSLLQHSLWYKVFLNKFWRCYGPIMSERSLTELSCIMSNFTRFL